MEPLLAQVICFKDYFVESRPYKWSKFGILIPNCNVCRKFNTTRQVQYNSHCRSWLCVKCYTNGYLDGKIGTVVHNGKYPLRETSYIKDSKCSLCRVKMHTGWCTLLPDAQFLCMDCAGVYFYVLTAVKT
jgi:hypothetical protein